MPRRTKIVATLGPASNDEKTIRQLIEAGVNVFRLNFSHGSAEEHTLRAETIRAVAGELKTPVGILCDMQGPKIRIGCFANDMKISLANGDMFRLDSQIGLHEGNQDGVFIDSDLLNDIGVDDILLLDDGRLTFTVESRNDHSVTCRVTQGGPLSSKKGVNKFGGGCSGTRVWSYLGPHCFAPLRCIYPDTVSACRIMRVHWTRIIRADNCPCNANKQLDCRMHNTTGRNRWDSNSASRYFRKRRREFGEFHHRCNDDVCAVYFPWRDIGAKCSTDTRPRVRWHCCDAHPGSGTWAGLLRASCLRIWRLTRSAGSVSWVQQCEMQQSAECTRFRLSLSQNSRSERFER